MSERRTPRVVVVDDDPSLADGHAAQLDGYHVETAYGGEEALDVVDADVDVVLLDRRMPRVSGDEVLERLRDRDLDCRVVLLTGVEPATDIVSMGFDEYLRKPVGRDELRETVDRMVRRSAYDEKLQEYFALASKRATLETEVAAADLRDDRAFRGLCERLAAVQDQLDETLDDLPAADGYFVATALPDVDAGTN